MKTIDLGSDNRPEQPSLETKIGLYWLHKIGIVSLVFGIVFLIMYSFTLMGAGAKLLIGAAVSLVLILSGERMAEKEKQQWYGQGLVAGGWSLAYFTAYAAYYLPNVQVISSLLFETIFLLAVAAGSLLSAIRARSEIMSILSISLAAASILLSGPGLVSDISFVIIALSCAILGNTQNWNKLFAFGMAACYGGHFYCSGALDPNSFFSHIDTEMATVFLALLWLIFGVGIGYSFKVANANKIQTILSYFNAAALAVGLFIFSGHNTPETSELLLSAAGAVYLGMSKWLHKRNSGTSIAHALLGLSLINAAKAIRFTGINLLTFDILQIGLLALLGLKYDIKSFRWFAKLLAILFVPSWILLALVDQNDLFAGFHAFACVKIGALAIAVLGMLAWNYSTKAIENEQNDNRNYQDFYYLATNAMLSLVLFMIADSGWQTAAFMFQAVFNHFCALRLKDTFYGSIGTTYFLLAAIGIIFNIMHWMVFPMLMVSCVCYGAYASSLKTNSN